ncbi:hypothetical protein E3U43_001520 [Larimichthys crocea]|uniref:Uncharacterized protein n=1 Tax=Larimichthys crocea TaxID=215358 RepID=A0ACD3RD08_LARCR|nr:hypothetical protein E3U43_001520 [Larimichthys crocea]
MLCTLSPPSSLCHRFSLGIDCQPPVRQVPCDQNTTEEREERETSRINMSKEGEKAAVFRTTKVRNKLKDDGSWLQRRPEP